MKCEIERMEINYTFYFLPFEKSDKKTIGILLLEKQEDIFLQPFHRGSRSA